MNRIWIILGFMSSIVNSEHRFPYTRQTAITVGLCCVFAVYSVFCKVDTRIKQAKLLEASHLRKSRPPQRTELNASHQRASLKTKPTQKQDPETQNAAASPDDEFPSHPSMQTRPDPTQPTQKITPSNAIHHSPPLPRGRKTNEKKERPLTQYSTS